MENDNYGDLIKKDQVEETDVKSLQETELTQEDYNKEEILDNLLKGDIEELKKRHAEHYKGTDDEMSDDYENWLMGLTSDEIINILKNHEATK